MDFPDKNKNNNTEGKNKAKVEGKISKPELSESDFYLTPEGYKCFTEQYHLKRGHCCQSGCRHCPYGYDKKTNLI